MPTPPAHESPHWVRVPELSDAVGVSAGTDHSCALRESGEVACWGRGGDGQLGDGSLTDSDVPVPVYGMSDAVAVAVYQRSSCALHRSGDISCWGLGAEGDLGSGCICKSTTGPITLETVRAPTPELVQGVQGATALSARAGSSFGDTWTACALLETGEVVCFGALERDADCNSMVVKLEISDARAVDRDCALGALGELVCASTVGHPPASLYGAVAIAIGSSQYVGSPQPGGHSCALDEYGAALCWGAGTRGQLGDGRKKDSPTPVLLAGVSDATAIDVDEFHTCVLRASGEVSCAGPGLSTIVEWTDAQIATVPTTLVEARDVVDISLFGGYGPDFCVALSSGNVECWQNPS